MSLKEVAKKAYVYGFSLVFNVDEIVQHVDQGVGANKAAPFNHFSHAETLAGPEDTFVTINNDTVYSMAQLDLSGGPVYFEVPKTGNRYFVFQCIDAWTNNFAYIGTRSIGKEGGKFLFLPPHSEAVDSGDAQVIQCPTTMISILGRWACEGEEDLPAVLALQKETRLAPLVGNTEVKKRLILSEVPESLLFWEKLRVYLQAFPDSAIFQPIQKEIESLGLWEAESPYVNPSAELLEALVAGQSEGQAYLKDYLLNGKIDMQNGWQLAYNAFDYNTEFFDFGTLKSDQWVMPTRTSEEIDAVWRQRSASALGGLWGNHGYEACYASVYVDSKGELLMGENTYQITLQPEPPVEAFWSITMYDVPNYYLVANESQRYSIGDRTKGLVYQEDGSLVLTMSATPPTTDEGKANWLPAPKGQFRPILRMYLPTDEITSQTYVIPPLVKIEP